MTLVGGFRSDNEGAARALANNSRRTGTCVLDSFIDATSWQNTIDTLSQWARTGQSRYVCICNVHVVVTAKQHPEFQRVVNGADMATPDGMPLAWVLRRSGFEHQERINGPDLMWTLCNHAERERLSIFLYGSTPHTLEKLVCRLKTAFPQLMIAGIFSPPFRYLSVEEDRETTDLINSSGARIVFVGLGCPKQELWMAAHRGKVRGVMIGVGAAFDYHAGTVKRAPIWMRQVGLEWLCRLMSDPKRLWKRYLITHSLFLLYLGLGFFRPKRRSLLVSATLHNHKETAPDDP